MNVIRRFLAATFVLFATSVAFAQRVPLSDSLSPQQIYSVDLSWQTTEMNRVVTAMLQGNSSLLPPLQGQLNGVEIRLDVRQYVGRRARVYMRLPASIVGVQQPGSLNVRWQTRGVLYDGELKPGQEALIFDGQIETAQLTDIFNF